MDEPENSPLDLPGRTEKGLRRFRKEERKQMIDTLHDLIEESRKRATSQYTPAKDRVKWVKLTGQLIWYKDHVLSNYDFERLAIEFKALKKKLEEDAANKKAELLKPTYMIPTWGTPEPEQEKKPEDKSENKQSETADKEDRLYPESE
jgi:hypothetical protein